MSKEFIKEKIGHKSLEVARRQQEQLTYLTVSEVQEKITTQYAEQFCKRQPNDPFLSWVWNILKVKNFQSFFEYLRFPLASSGIVHNKIEPHLERVFFSDDGYQRYTLRGDEFDPELDSEKFNKDIFKALLYNYNDLLVHDLKDENTPFRFILSINRVVAIESYDSTIFRVAYTAEINIEGVRKVGYIYIDSENYIFYDKELKDDPIVWPHDLGECPVDYVSAEPFGDDDVVRESTFSRVRDKLEEYVYLKTLQRMVDNNGAIPIVTMLDATDDDEEEKIDDVQSPMGSSTATYTNKEKEEGGLIQSGTIYKIPQVENKQTGQIDVSLTENFLKFHRAPVDSLEYLKQGLTTHCKRLLIQSLGITMNKTNQLRTSYKYQSLTLACKTSSGALVIS